MNTAPKSMFTSNAVLKERYRLQRQLGDNPVRQTWLAEDLASGELVVIKLLPFFKIDAVAGFKAV
ncbi:hypothetical protein [[Phormidium] sp. ETS-05]|uniref:hypothetical protein n=1 Tax=[Phormidium] sp. ETS-05 TaxID=222819 RepID=UPI0031FF15C0